MSVAAIESVIEMPPLTPLPVMPPAMLGVVELRGALLPIYSPAHVLRTVLEAPGAALIARRAGGRGDATRSIGIAIDGAEDVVLYDPDAWGGVGGPLPQGGLVRGVGTCDGHLTTLLDASLFIAACCATAGEEE